MSAAAVAAATSAARIRCTRRLRVPLDELVVQPLDRGEVATSMASTAVSVVTWCLPVKYLQAKVHRRYEVESSFVDLQAASDEVANLGLVTVVCGQFSGLKTGFLERTLDPPPHSSVSLRISVVDRQHWHRTAWGVGSVCSSLFWGRFAKQICGVNMDFRNPVTVESKFNAEKEKYDSYSVKIPGLGFSMSLQDTGVTLLDPRAPLVEGFSDNESALRQLGLIPEVSFFGIGNSIYRQALWNTPMLPNVATLSAMEPGKLFTQFLGDDCPPPVGGAPIAAWLIKDVPETKIYKMESQRESDNDPDSMSYNGDRELTRRVEVKAMRRYFKFQETVRSRAVADVNGRELPR
jgi:hypothetical protein